MEPTAETQIPAPQRWGALRRIFGVLFNPGETFREIARAPDWRIPLAVMTLVAALLHGVIAQRADWRAISRQQIEKIGFLARQLEEKPVERERAITEGAQRGRIGQYVRGVIGTSLLAAFVAGIYLLAFNGIAGARLRYRTVFSLVLYTLLPMALRDLLGVPVQLLKEPDAIDPENFLASNIAAFLGENTPLWQLALAGSLDVFALWSLALRVIAFHAAEPKRISVGTAAGIVFGAYGLLVMAAAGIAFAFS